MSEIDWAARIAAENARDAAIREAGAAYDVELDRIRQEAYVAEVAARQAYNTAVETAQAAYQEALRPAAD